MISLDGGAATPRSRSAGRYAAVVTLHSRFEWGFIADIQPGIWSTQTMTRCVSSIFADEKTRWLRTLTLIVFFLSGCQGSTETQLTSDERATITAEIRRTLDEYADAVKRKDLDRMLTFWSNSEEFVFAGDGHILGGYDQWARAITRDNEGTARWLKWEYGNINIVVLSRSSASCTLTFEYGKLTTDGKTVNARGAWTYVFKKVDGAWKVIQTNGTHLEF